MNPTRLLGTLVLAVGGSLLVSERLRGQDLLAALTGFSLRPLRAVCAIALVLGAFAARLGRREEKGFHHHKEE